jgi:uncharacterized protein
MSGVETIDGRQFARDRGVVAGTLGIDNLPRLAELGCDAAELRYEIRGLKHPDGRFSLAVSVAGSVRLACQRCLGPLLLPIEVANELELADTQADIDHADDEIDRVLATKSMNVAQLVEDEAMLTLPMVPAHDRCESGVAMSETAAQSPFAALERLRKDRIGPRG